MNNEYWEAVMDDVCDQHGLDISIEKSAEIAKDLCAAAGVAGEMCGDPSFRVNPVKEVNPFEARCKMLEDALDRLAHRFGVGVDADRMEINYMQSISSSHAATTREKI
jgi:hypothetical protein